MRHDTVAGLEAELAVIDDIIVEAALDGDAEAFVRASMRKAALPTYVVRQKTEPLREHLGRIDRQLADLEVERERVKTEPPPEPPAGMRGTISAAMVRTRLLEGVAARERSASRERKEVLRQIAAIEREGVMVP